MQGDERADAENCAIVAAANDVCIVEGAAGA